MRDVTTLEERRFAFVTMKHVSISVLFVLLVLCLRSSAHAANREGLELGVIRWDGVGSPTDVGTKVEQILSPSQYHNRLPFYASNPGEYPVSIRETTQARMNEDIQYANDAGISFWAFVRYESNSGGLDSARTMFESSNAVRGKLKYAEIIDGTGANGGNRNFAALVADFDKAYYEKVLGKRPLLFVLTYEGSLTGYNRAEIDQIRSLSTVNPYIVVLNEDATRAQDFADYLGADATSSYKSAGYNGFPYSSFMSGEQSLWNYRIQPNRKVIPWVTTGWDPRPRIDVQSSGTWWWGSYPSNQWVQQATPTQIGQQLQAALDWRAAHSDATEAPVVLMYAWNEFDEGGWICPTHTDGTARIDAVADVMRYSASSNWDGSQTARKAFDGNSSTNWQAANGSSFSGQWLEVDFGVESTFSSATISEYGNRTQYFQIQYRAGDSWKTAYYGYSIGSGTTVTFPEVRSRRARLYFSSGIYTPIIYEFNVAAQPAAANSNLAANKAYSSSSQWNSSQSADYAFDGNPSTNWQAAQGSSFGSQWLQINFGDVTTFNTVKLSEYGNRTGSYAIEYWANGWHTAYTGYGIGSSSQVTFPSITSTAIRLRFISGLYTPVIYEFGVEFN